MIENAFPLVKVIANLALQLGTSSVRRSLNNRIDMPNTAHPPTAPVLDTAYAQQLQCGRQWRGFLNALGQEFSAALPAQDVALLMARIGVRFASQNPLAASDTIEGLQAAMNAVWGPLDWGRVDIAQTPAGMDIRHRFCPLAAAFGTSQADWAVGFLQGAYQQWFDSAGAGGLKVQPVTGLDSLGSAQLRLGAA